MSRFNEHMSKILCMALAKGEGCQVLDCGCGDGRVSRWLAERGLKVTAFDKVFQQGWGGVSVSGVRLLQADIHSLTVRKLFDVVALFGVLHYALGEEDLREMLLRSREWLKQDGLLVLNWITDDVPHLDPQVYLPSKDLVESELRALDLALVCSWTADVEHAHGGPWHRHRIAYAAWEYDRVSMSTSNSMQPEQGDDQPLSSENMLAPSKGKLGEVRDASSIDLRSSGDLVESLGRAMTALGPG